jgi:acyl-coenzyme A thioesterase PaaI-like protein
MFPANLLDDTAVHADPAAPGCYTAHLPPHWNYVIPSGGVAMTIALRALMAELPGLRLSSATAIFCSPVLDGPLQIRTTILRRGKLATQARASVTSEKTLGAGGAGLEVSATFAADVDGPTGTFVEMPGRILPVEATSAPSVDPVLIDVPFFKNVEMRGALDGNEPDARGPHEARWYRYRVAPRLADGRLDPRAIPPIADTMPPGLRAALGPDAPPFIAPSLDLTLHFLNDTTREWLCTSITCRDARGGRASADVEVWDDEGRLVAYGTQVMLVKTR